MITVAQRRTTEKYDNQRSHQTNGKLFICLFLRIDNTVSSSSAALLRQNKKDTAHIVTIKQVTLPLRALLLFPLRKTLWKIEIICLKTILLKLKQAIQYDCFVFLLLLSLCWCFATEAISHTLTHCEHFHEKEEKKIEIHIWIDNEHIHVTISNEFGHMNDLVVGCRWLTVRCTLSLA